MLKQGCRIAAREPTATPGRSRTTGFSRHLPQDLVNDQLGRLALFSLIAMVLWTAGSADRSARDSDQSRRLPKSQGGRPASSRWSASSSRASMFVYVRYARHTPEMKTNISLALSAPQCRGNRCVEYMGRAAAHAGADRRRVVDRDSAARLFNGCGRQPRQDAGGGACGSVASIRSASGLRICAACRLPSPSWDAS